MDWRNLALTSGMSRSTNEMTMAYSSSRNATISDGPSADLFLDHLSAHADGEPPRG